MPTINSSLLQNHAIELLQSFQVSKIPNISPNQGENKTAIEKINEIITGQTDKTVATARARIAEAHLEASKSELENNSDAPFGLSVGGVYYEKVADMSEGVQINAYIAAKQVERYLREEYISSGAVDNPYTTWDFLYDQQGTDQTYWRFGGEVDADSDLSAYVASQYFQNHLGEVLTEDVIGTDGRSGVFSYKEYDFVPVFQEFSRVMVITSQIEYYFQETYGLNSLEYLTLSENLVEDRAEILTERDTIVSEFGVNSTEHVAYINNFYYEKTQLNYARIETAEGLEINFIRTSTGYGSILKQKSEAGMQPVTIGSEIEELNSFESETLEDTLYYAQRRITDQGVLEALETGLEELTANGHATMTEMPLTKGVT
ncbi:hypothetical protein [Flexibacterium corallicola]|uniref:hypothetical protein n=1 Tax=Flexibacterium corallicola TaxID=3037259 RepID=UPI00286F30FD|nr:hypothetical protein [Pseudovibrio sp. M1P-2-3]